MKKLNKKEVRALVIFLVIIAVVTYFVVKLVKPKKQEAATYRTEAVTIGDVRSQVITTGTVYAITMVDVGSQVSGKIIALYADFNDKVKKGDKLAEIDQESIKMQIRQQEANYLISKTALDKAILTRDNSKTKYDRSKQLFDKKLLSVEELETSEIAYQNAEADVKSADARLKQSEAQLNSAKVDLTHTVIISPIDGIVIDRPVNVGQTVAASMQAPILFKIANDLSKMLVQCNVDESEISKVVPGQNVEFTVATYGKKIFYGKVVQKRLNAITASNVVNYPAIIHVDNPEGLLMPGMTATVTFIAAEAKGVLLVPTTALKFTPSQQPSAKAAAKPGEKKAAIASQQQDIGTVWKLDSQGNPYAISVRTGVSNPNTKTEIKEAEELRQQWEKKHPRPPRKKEGPPPGKKMPEGQDAMRLPEPGPKPIK